MTYLFVIDTNKYVGNFLRELCGYTTGQIGDCEVGYEEADRATADIDKSDLEWFEENTVQVPDDYGEYRPVSAFDSESEPILKSVAIFFHEAPPTAIVNLMVQRSIQFSIKESSFEIIGFRILKQEILYTKLQSIGIPEQ